MNQDELSLINMTNIVQTDDVLGGEPRIEGTRIGVLDVYELVVKGGHSPADIADQLNRSLGEIYTALAYYHEHPEAMRALRHAQTDTKRTLAAEGLQPPETVQ
jgi:uncharacterized protein (DUF433 family)